MRSSQPWNLDVGAACMHVGAVCSPILVAEDVTCLAAEEVSDHAHLVLSRLVKGSRSAAVKLNTSQPW